MPPYARSYGLTPVSSVVVTPLTQSDAVLTYLGLQPAVATVPPRGTAG